MKSHYEIVICACCFLSLFVNIGLISTSFSVYQPYLVALEYVGDAGGSMILAVRLISTIVVMTFVDRYYDLLDVRVGLSMSMALAGAGFALFGLASSFVGFLVAAVVAGAAYGFGGLVATTMLLNRWYKSGIGTALGASTLGSGVAGVVIPVIMSRVIEGSSLSTAFFVASGICFASGVVAFVFLRNNPSDVGMEPHVSKVAEKAKKRGSAPDQSSRILPRKAQIAVLIAAALVGSFCLNAGAYMSVLLVSSGFDIHFAALMLSTFGASLTFSKFAFGALLDRAGTLVASEILFSVLVVGLSMLCLVGVVGEIGVAVAAVCVGCGLTLGSVGLSVWSLELSNPGVQTKSIKNCQLAYSAGGLAMNVVPGPLKTLVGSYVPSYVMMLIFACAAAVLIIGLYRRYRA